ncbi:hypothetical protein GCM10010329_19010 [Streptomyces spiroverticillatus]|uniref:Uncharacterized protein n=1 Tax=Streptomyces finlayi TaxID=67296 RepID=A0A918WU52_9ACTN|nr:hypothetical protein GCM10010329_19010 [Streptomyces spiroverticillatus]GHC82875.1 hypothetical protein GCM10010334_11490 [Streptomyces finlayi]
MRYCKAFIGQYGTRPCLRRTITVRHKARVPCCTDRVRGLLAVVAAGAYACLYRCASGLTALRAGSWGCVMDVRQNTAARKRVVATASATGAAAAFSDVPVSDALARMRAHAFSHQSVEGAGPW